MQPVNFSLGKKQIAFRENRGRSCLGDIQLRRAWGYIVESGLETELRDALASRIYSGTSELRQVILVA
jgi:alkylation response protein AidB-like acyl-CoA dehydrogenase